MKKTLLLITITLFLNLVFVPSTFAFNDKNARFTEKMKTEISKIGTGQDAKVKLKLKDGTKIKGYIMEANEDQFVVMNAKTGQAVPIAYPQVGQAKGNNLSTGVVIVIGVAVLIAIVFIVGNSLK